MMDEQIAWQRSRRKNRLRILAVFLILSAFLTAYPNITKVLLAMAVESQDRDDILYVTRFESLPKEIREQSVSVGTDMEELNLPDRLEVSIAVDNAASEEPSEGENDDSGLEHDAENETEEKAEDFSEETGKKAEESFKETGGKTEESFEETGKKAEESFGETEEKIQDRSEMTGGGVKETRTVTLPEYQSQNEITSKTL